MKKDLAIKLVSGVLVVALVVVAALAIAGVFNVQNVSNTDIALADNDPSVEDQAMFRGFAADTVLYVQAVNGSKLKGDTYSIIRVKDSNGQEVKTVWQDGSGIKPENGWKPGMYYSVNLMSGYVFANKEYKGLDAFECIVANRESNEADTVVSSNVVYLNPSYITDETFSKVKKDYAPDEKVMYTLIANTDVENPVFVVDNGLDSKSYAVVSKNGNKYTVVDAELEDVYDSIYINKSFALDSTSFDSWEVDEDATEASIRNSEWFLAAADAIYGANEKEKNEYISVKFSPNFEAGSPSKVKLNISIKFSGITKKSDGSRDKESVIEIKIANTFIPVFDVHIQNEDGDKAFDVALSLDVETTASVTYTFGRSYSSNGEDANPTLESIANKVAQIVRDVTADKLGNKPTDGPYYFAKWIIPIGALPICIEDNLGVEIKASFSGQVGVTATNRFHTEVGVVYADGKCSGFGNVDDNFHFDGIDLACNAGVKVGLVNEVGISAYGVIAVDLGLHAGVYADFAGRLDLDGDDIIKLFAREGGLNIIPAYYLEAGVYVDLDLSGKVFTFTIAKLNILAKKFPLFTLGHKYLPVVGVDNPFVDETIYMEASYYYFTNWDVNAKDIQDITAPAVAKTLAYSEFDYEVGPNLRLDDNRLVATVAGEFESYVIVTSKVNKQLSKKVTIIKNPELPTATVKEAVYDKKDAKNAYDDDVYYNVYLNGSKIIGVSIDGVAKDYTCSDGKLVIKEKEVAKLAYGEHVVCVESSKGYLNLVLRVINSEAVAVNTSAKTYDKAASGAVVWDMALQGNDIVSVKEDGEVVDSTYYSYRDSDGKFAMTAAYWGAKDLGDYVEEITLANGDKYQLAVSVKDTRSAKLLTSEYVYVKGSNENLELQAEMYNNAVSTITFAGSTFAASSAVIDREYFDGKDAGTYTGAINGVLNFTVTITDASNPLIIPVQNGVFYKSQNNDVIFQVKKMASDISIANCDGLVVGNNSITIKGDFLAKQTGSQWQGTIQGASNVVTITIDLINDLLPSLEKSEYTISGNDNVLVKWDLQGYALDTIYVDGLNTYKVTLDGLQVSGADLAYGVTAATIYTPVNALSFSVNHSGTAAFKTGSYSLNKNMEAVVGYQLDVAHLSFSYLTVDGADILPTQYRYNNGELTLSNDFAYNLAVGTYTINAHLSDDSVVSATLTIQGEAKSANTVGSGDRSDPFLIYTADQLANVYSYVNKGTNNENTMSFKLMADIDMYGYSVEPIGNKNRPYKGIFDGNGYTISNLSITKTVEIEDGYAIGMFGYVKGGTIKGVVLSKASISYAQSGSVSCGLIAGYTEGGLIEKVSINGSSIYCESKSFLNLKNAFFDVGGIVGYNKGGTINNASVTATIKGSVKGLNVAGLQIGGRKSIVSVGGVVGNFATENGDSEKLILNVSGSVNVDVAVDKGKGVNVNGWYGYTDLAEDVVAKCARRCKISVTE